MPIVGNVKYPGDSIKKKKCAKKIVKCLGISPKLPQNVKAKKKVLAVLNTIHVKKPPLDVLTPAQLKQKAANASYYQKHKVALNKKHIAYNKKNKAKINVVRNILRADKKKKGLV
jgi:hypothetical protein